MTMFKLLFRSLRFHGRSHLGALLGAAVGSAVLIGALVVGDSVRGSLREMALARLGGAQTALASTDRFFRAQLADDLARSVSGPVAPGLQVQGTAASSDGSARANRVQVLGVDERFWSLARQPVSFPLPAADEVVLNQQLAEQLNAQVGQTVLLRVEKPSRLSREAPISPQEDFALALRVTVRAIASDSQWGRFSLQANQVPPFNAFVPLSWLSERLQIAGRANLMLAGGTNTAERLTTALHENWQLADAELELRELPDSRGLELRTSRVFLDPAVVNAATNASSNATGVLTYFVNELRVGNRATPYSMVTAMGAPVVPADMRDNEILINHWLANDLQAKPGDLLRLTYYEIGASRRLQEQTNQFTVRGVVPLAGAAADRTLMPDFPGLEKAESTRDWDSSLPIKLDRIRPQDEEYWKQYRGTPKAFVRLAAGHKMWTNRFGNLTAVRYPAGTAAPEMSRAILRALDPTAVGFTFQPVRQQALAASEQAQDFGQLFLGFSFFLIAAALLLMALLFQFGIEKRTAEVGTLLALGFTPKQVRRLLLGEGVALALAGAVLGVPGGIAYARVMLYGLSTIWRTAVGTSALHYHAQPLTLVIGAASGAVVAWVTIWLALRKQARQPARELLAADAASETSMVFRRQSRGIWIGWLASALAMLMIGWAGLEEQTANPEVFFLAGTLLLISGLGFAAAFLSAMAGSETAQRPTLSGMGLRSATRRRRRSLATVGLLACGSFIVAAIGVFKLESNDAVHSPPSGTGGFALVGECTLPIVHDLNTEEGRQFFGLDAKDLAGVRAVPLRVRDGDDASCLNLNRAQRPRLLGVRPERLSERHAFTFTKVAAGLPTDKPWLLLKRRFPDGSVPAIGDAASIQWALGKNVGDTLSYTDDRGHEFKIRLVGSVANSILQGSLLIAESEFLARFPSESGYRMFLIDVQPYQPARINAVAATLSRATQDYGMQLLPAARRLAQFNAVQNTYLNTFQVLGGLGLLLGSIGLGVVVLRNVLERRGELALLLAVGFRPRALRWLVLSEHGALLLMGLFIGSVAAFVAVLPTLLSPGVALPIRSLAWTLAAILASGSVWTWAATRLALRGRLLDALRNE
jgi:putative ABC transport system permease protein